jgi:hypothetical protein
LFTNVDGRIENRWVLRILLNLELRLRVILRKILLVQQQDLLLRLDGLSWTVTARPAMTSLVPVERSIRILDIDLSGTVPLVAIPSFLMRRIVVE